MDLCQLSVDRRAIFHALLSLTMLFGTAAVADGRRSNEGRIDVVELPSPILSRPIRASVYLPGAYYNDGKRRFPVVYLLHGHGDDHTAWSRLGQIKSTLDRMIAEGSLKPLIAVMPDAGKSWYVNDARTNGDGYGHVFDAFRSNLLDAVDQRFRSIPCRHGRAIGGLSMGGYGALLLGLAEPVRFISVFSLSGAVYSARAIDDPRRSVRLRALFGGVHGEPVSQQRLKEWSIFGRLRAIVPTVKTPHVWISAGDDDFFAAIVTGSANAHNILRQRGVSSELRIDDAGHTWVYWRESVKPALSWASKRFRQAC